jgi:zinc transporter
MNRPIQPPGTTDDHGLICGYLFQPQGEATAETAGLRARPVDTRQAAEWLDRAENDPEWPGFIWLHFNFTHNTAERWLTGRMAPVSPLIEMLHSSGATSTRVERSEQTLLAVINDVRFEFDFEPSDIATLWISLDQRLMITGRRQPLRSVDLLRMSVRDGELVRSTAELMAHLLRRQVDVLSEVVRRITVRVDEVEDRFLAERLNPKRSRLGALRRLLVRLQRLLVPEPAALFRLLQHPPEWMQDNDVQELREALEEFTVVLRDMVSLQERVKLLQEEVAAQVGEENNRSLFMLTTVTVMVLPINIISGLLGMNVGGIPLASHPQGFLIVVAVVVSLTVLVTLLILRWRREVD